MRANRSIPQCTVIAELAYPDINAGIDWLCDAFGFTLRLRIADHRAQINVGDGAVVLTHMDGSMADLTHSVLVRVADVDRHHDHAKRRGAQILRPPADHPYGERQYTAVDLVGRRWTFSQTIADVAPEDWGGTSGEL